MIILGVNAYHGDAAAAIVRDGELIAAVEEERFNRIKHCAGFPTLSIRYCLRAAGIGIEEVDHVGISRDPSAHLHKKILFSARRLSQRGKEARRAEGRRQEAEGRRQEAVSSQYHLRQRVGELLERSQWENAQRDADGTSALPAIVNSSVDDSAAGDVDRASAL